MCQWDNVAHRRENTKYGDWRVREDWKKSMDKVMKEIKLTVPVLTIMDICSWW